MPLSQARILPLIFSCSLGGTRRVVCDYSAMIGFEDTQYLLILFGLPFFFSKKKVKGGSRTAPTCVVCCSLGQKLFAEESGEGR